MEFHAGKYRLNLPPAEGACRIGLTDEGVVIAPEGGGEISLYYSDIDRVSDRNHELELQMFDGRVVTVWFLGTWYGQCLADLRLQRGAQLVRNLGMLDAERQKEFRGACGGVPCTITLYRTSLVVESDAGDFWNAAYADIETMAFNPEAYSLDLQLDLGERFSFRMLGNRFGELEQEIRRLTAAMYDRTASALAELGLAGDTARSLALMLRQGKAVRQDRVLALAPAFWPTFAPERQASLDYLRSVTDQVYVGFRESFGEGEPVYWYVAVFPERGTMAVEVPSEEGNATYVYRLDGPVEQSVALLSRALVALNFRREVISCSEAQLAEGRMARYRVAVRKLPYVQRLRELFVGKAAHTDGWQRRIDDLLSNKVRSS